MIAPFKPSLTPLTVVNDGSGAAAGTLLSYTVPAARSFLFASGGWLLTAGVAPVIQLQIVTGGLTISVRAVLTGIAVESPIWLNAGDVIRWEVTTLGAGATCDAYLCGAEYLV